VSVGMSLVFNAAFRLQTESPVFMRVLMTLKSVKRSSKISSKLPVDNGLGTDVIALGKSLFPHLCSAAQSPNSPSVCAAFLRDRLSLCVSTQGDVHDCVEADPPGVRLTFSALALLGSL
jgi:hypothetical protein